MMVILSSIPLQYHSNSRKHWSGRSPKCWTGNYGDSADCSRPSCQWCNPYCGCGLADVSTCITSQIQNHSYSKLRGTYMKLVLFVTQQDNLTVHTRCRYILSQFTISNSFYTVYFCHILKTMACFHSRFYCKMIHLERCILNIVFQTKFG